jgi:hypothetical protein
VIQFGLPYSIRDNDSKPSLIYSSKSPDKIPENNDMISLDGVVDTIESFVRQEEIAAPLRYLCDKLPPQADLYIVGGALRNIVIEIVHGYRPEIVDIDIIIGSLGKNFSFDKVLAGKQYRLTEFGGVRWFPKDSSYSFDLSILENFLPIEKFHLAPTLESLIKTIDFTVNVIIYDVKKKVLHQKNIIHHIQKATVGFNSDQVYDKILLAYRLLVIRHKTGFYVSEHAFTFLRNSIGLDSVNVLIKILESKVGKKRAKKIIDEYDRMCMYKSYEDYRSKEHLLTINA